MSKKMRLVIEALRDVASQAGFDRAIHIAELEKQRIELEGEINTQYDLFTNEIAHIQAESDQGHQALTKLETEFSTQKDVLGHMDDCYLASRESTKKLCNKLNLPEYSDDDQILNAISLLIQRSDILGKIQDAPQKKKAVPKKKTVSKKKAVR